MEIYMLYSYMYIAHCLLHIANRYGTQRYVSMYGAYGMYSMYSMYSSYGRVCTDRTVCTHVGTYVGRY